MYHDFASCFGSTVPKMCCHEPKTEEHEVSVQKGVNSLNSSPQIKVGTPPANEGEDKYTASNKTSESLRGPARHHPDVAVDL